VDSFQITRYRKDQAKNRGKGSGVFTTSTEIRFGIAELEILTGGYRKTKHERGK